MRKKNMVMTRRNENDLMQIIKNTFAVQGVGILKFKIEHTQSYTVRLIADLFANLKRDCRDLARMELDFTDEEADSKDIATIITRALLSNLRVIDEQFSIAESDDTIIETCHEDLSKAFNDESKEYGATFIVKSYLDSRKQFLDDLHDLMFNVGQDLFLEKIDQPSLLDENMPLPDLSSKIMALEFSKFVKNQWLLDSNSIVPDAEHAALKINNYNLFVQYLDEDNEVKYTKQDLMKLQDMVLRGFRIKG